MPPYHLRHPASLSRVTVHVPSPTKKMAAAAIFVLLYAIVLPWVYSTVGEPYNTALKELSSIEAKNRGGATVKMDKAKSKKHKEVLDAGGVSVMNFDEVDDDEENAFGSRRVKQKRRKERKKLKKKLKKDGKADTEIAKLTVDPVLEAIEEKERLPSAFLPSALSSFTFFFLATATALFFLLQKWMVWFRVFVFFDHHSGPIHGECYVQITPPSHRGKPAVTKLLPRSSATGGHFQFVFQRQKYTVYPAGSKEHDAGSASPSSQKTQSDTVMSAEEESTVITGQGHKNGTVRLIACPVTEPLETYRSWKGLGRREVKRQSDVYGPNVLAVELPRFIDLWFERLLSPISVFQLFSAALWLLDAYWQYTMMTLVQILILESTTVFQRLKTLKTLKGMSVTAFDVHTYREGKWILESSQKLVPGDLISLKLTKPPTSTSTDKGAVVPAGQTAPKNAKPPVSVNAASNIVPCDCVIVRGSAVVNEATLTGESIPQMKDSLGHTKKVSSSRLSVESSSKEKEAHISSGQNLDMSGEHRVHTLFSGTSLVATSSGYKDVNPGDIEIPCPPDGGCTCYVLRTGFNSSQGKLVQLIEFSTESVSGDARETTMALLLLLCFALMSSGYVLKKGLEQGDRTTHELMIKCVIILTSVVPRQLPLQMAFAVNQAILALNKKAIMCTEPYRVPICGKTTHCIFDKTGTLTTDQMLPIGIVNASSSKAKGNVNKLVQPLEPVLQAKGAVSMVLGACHSIIHVEGAGMMGDPIETAALKGIGWSYNAASSTASPGDWQSAKVALDKIEVELRARPNDKGLLKRKELLEKTIEERKVAGQKSPVKSVKILHRHHFASKLKRMSVVARVESNLSSTSADEFSGYYCLVKGAPEAIKSLMADGAVPDWYDRTVFDLTHRGFRVLGLAYRKCDGIGSSSTATKLARNEVEANLQFAGFIAFECKNRADSEIVVKALRQSNHVVAMATGDNALTALHVGRKVGICDPEKPYLVLTERADENPAVHWETTPSPDDEGAQVEKIPFTVSSLVALAKKYSLATTESALDKAGAIDDKVWDHVDQICIFARMSPQGKARVIRSMQTRQGHSVFMCGDGGNDVGALKQADVGLALLSGYGNTNTTGANSDSKDAAKAGEGNAENLLNQTTKELQKRSARANAKVKDLLNKKRIELTKKVQGEWLQEEIAKRKARGDTGIFSYAGAMKDATTRMQRELMVEKRRLSKIHGNVFDDKPPSIESLLDGAGGDDTSIIRPGDASIAAPFTSRQPSIKSAIDLIRQGRCTLLRQ